MQVRIHAPARYSDAGVLLTPVTAGVEMVWRVDCPTCAPATGSQLATTCAACTRCRDPVGKVTVDGRLGQSIGALRNRLRDRPGPILVHGPDESSTGSTAT